MKSSNLLRLIRESASTRKFTSKRVEEKHVDAILEAGMWGPSLFGIQPWNFVVTQDKKSIENISRAVSDISESKEGALGKLIAMSANIISCANLIVAVYVNKRVRNGAAKHGINCKKKGEISELIAAGGAMHNMFLMANSLGLGCVHLDAPVIFPQKADKIFKGDGDLIAIVAIGHPSLAGRRSKRWKDRTIRFI